MRAIVLAGLLCSGCFLDSAAVQDCEADLKRVLRSPSTYKRLSYDETPVRRVNEVWISIEYDAANAYGTPIRGSRLCKYRMNSGGTADVETGDLYPAQLQNSLMSNTSESDIDEQDAAYNKIIELRKSDR